MRTILLILLCGTLFLPSYAQLRLAENPEAGKPVRILDGNPQAKLTLLFYDRDGKATEAESPSATVPENTVLLQVITTTPDGAVDSNNGKGYMFPVYKEGKPVQKPKPPHH